MSDHYEMQIADLEEVTDGLENKLALLNAFYTEGFERRGETIDKLKAVLEINNNKLCSLSVVKHHMVEEEYWRIEDVVKSTEVILKELFPEDYK